MNKPNSDPFDQTVWDPLGPEHAIEDTFHGPEARLTLLSILPFPNEDGTYYVFGGYYVCGTNTFDSEGRPFIQISASGSTMHKAHRDAFRHMEWIDKWRAGKLSSFEDMNYPVFQLDAAPYLAVEGVSDPRPAADLGGIAATDTIDLELFPISLAPIEMADLSDHVQEARRFFKHKK